MRVCLIAEGSYPYVVGGVSSWLHQIVSSMPGTEFFIVAINPESKVRGKYKYKLPSNVVGFQDVFLDERRSGKGRWNRKLHLEPEEQAAFRAMIHMQDPDWPVWFRFFENCRKNGVDSKEILASRIFYDLVQSSYEEKYPNLPFLDYYWTLRSMFETIFSLLLVEYPRADVYHAASTGYAGLVGAYAAQLGGGALVVTEHGIYTREREEEIIKADWVKGHLKNIWIDFFYLLSNCAYACASQVVTLFSKSRDLIVEIGCPIGKTSIIHNGIDSERFRKTAGIIEGRGPRRTLHIGSITRVVPIKDIKTMLQAFALVGKRLSDVRFSIIGPTDEDPEYFKECLEYRDQLSLESVVFTGSVDILHYLEDLDILVLTSISEGQPLAILEGFACGLPFVTTNVGDCESLVNGEDDDYGPAGLVVPVMDSTRIADAILRLCEDEEFRLSCGRNARRRVQANYLQSSVIRTYQRIYDGVKTRSD